MVRGSSRLEVEVGDNKLPDIPLLFFSDCICTWGSWCRHSLALATSFCGVKITGKMYVKEWLQLNDIIILPYTQKGKIWWRWRSDMQRTATQTRCTDALGYTWTNVFCTKTRQVTSHARLVNLFYVCFQQYNVEIKDMEQPLLVHKPSSRDRRRGQTDMIYLIPELCVMTGNSLV